MTCSIVRNEIDLVALRYRIQHKKAGAVLIFCGDVRNHAQEQKVSYLEYEAHESMALKQIKNVINSAKKKWTLHNVEVIHRLGKLAIKDCSIAIAVATSHRAEAYESSKYIIDTIKHTVPVWKKEYFLNGTSEWSEGCEATSIVDEIFTTPKNI
tara:strand:+ start:1885 stop:2346 length:462 start_codon:yes stop_codon:yes gene_type:complete